MLKRLRVKFVCVFMTIAVVMLLVIFGMVVGSTWSNLERQSIQMLREVTEGPDKPGRPGRPGIRSYFSLELMPDGTLKSEGSGQYDLSDEAYLRTLLAAAEETGEESAVLLRYRLRFLREREGAGMRYIFADISVQVSTLRDLVLVCFSVGLLVFGLFFLAALLLARWMVRPVERAWEQQRQFVADASHELKTPLTVITTNAELLQSTREEDKRRRAEEGILIMSGQMRGLVESLLEQARVDSTLPDLQMEQVELSRLISDCVLPFDALFFEQELTLDLQIREDIRVRGSEGHLRQVVDILLDNAQKYASPGTEVRVELRRQGRGRCLFSVANAGKEIPREERRQIFERFYRGDKARAMNHSYGLGLSIAEGIVTRHGGKIWVECDGGINTFCVQLPCQ